MHAHIIIAWCRVLSAALVLFCFLGCDLPPVVTIMSPGSGSFFAVSATVPIKLSVTYPSGWLWQDGELDRIEIGSDIDGVLTSKSYTAVPTATLEDTITITGLSLGTHVIYCRAYNQAGLMGNDYVTLNVVTRTDIVAAEDVPEGSAGFTGTTVVVPGATILTDGGVSEDEIPVSGNALVGIKKGETTYLYHPAIGLAPLSWEGSLLAIHYFLEEQITAEEINARPAAGLQSAGQERIEIPEDGEVLLPTRVRVKRTGVTTLEITNELNRWAAVTVDGYTSAPYYFAPRDTAVPGNVFDALERFAKAVLSGSTLAESYHTRDDITAMEKIETFGAFRRAYETHQNAPFKESVLKAENLNPKLIRALNDVDSTMSWIRLMVALIKILPLECADAVVDLLNAGIGTAIVESYLDEGLDWQGTSTKYAFDAAKDIAQSLSFCAIDFQLGAPTAGTGALAFEMVNFAWDAYTAYCTYQDEVWNAPEEQLLNEAYAEAYLQDSRTAVQIAGVAASTLGALEVGKQGDITIECRATNAVTISADLSALGGGSSASLTKGSATSEKNWYSWSGRFSVTPVTSGSKTMTVTAYGAAGGTAQGSVALTVNETAASTTTTTSSGNLSAAECDVLKDVDWVVTEISSYECSCNSRLDATYPSGTAELVFKKRTDYKEYGERTLWGSYDISSELNTYCNYCQMSSNCCYAYCEYNTIEMFGVIATDSRCDWIMEDPEGSGISFATVDDPCQTIVP